MRSDSAVLYWRRVNQENFLICQDKPILPSVEKEAKEPQGNLDYLQKPKSFSSGIFRAQEKLIKMLKFVLIPIILLDALKYEKDWTTEAHQINFSST